MDTAVEWGGRGEEGGVGCVGRVNIFSLNAMIIKI